jgi:DNA-binding SARP family transcriptional activator
VATGTKAPSFRLLGGLRIEGARGELRGVKQRMLLAFLALHAGEVVSTERLVDAVWGDQAPPTAAAIVHGYVRKLRAVLEETPAELSTQAPGYVLRVDDGELDIRAFERLADEGREALRAGDAEAARTRLSSALDLWRGEPLGDLPAEGFVADERRRLEQRRAEATADRIAADLALGRSAELVAELEALVREQPFQEEPRKQLMLALYRSGRQVDALQLYRETRTFFVEELGIEPSRALQELEQAILRQDASLEPPAREPEPKAARRSGRRTSAILVAAAILAAAAVAAPLALSGGSTRPPKHRPAKILATFPVPLPSCCSYGFDAAWGAGHHDHLLERLDPSDGRVAGRWRIAGFQSGVPLAAAGSVWVPSARDTLVRFDPASGRIAARIPVQGGKVAFGYLDMWETTGSHQLDRIDISSNKVVATIRLAPGVNNWGDELAIGEGAVWAAVADDAVLDRIDPATNKIARSIKGFGNTDSGMPIAVDQNAVWVLRMVGGQETLFRVDPATNAIVKRIPIGSPNGTAPTGTVATGGGYIWTGNWDKTVSKIDPRTNRVVAVYSLPANPQNVTFGDGSLWVDSYDASKVWRIAPSG